MKVVTVNSKQLGSYHAFKNEDSKDAFKNKLTEAYLVELKESDIVVDIGAYIGEYSMYAAINGVRGITAYEPTPTTFNVLTKNCKRFNTIKTVNAAITGDKSKTVELSYTKGSVGVTNSIVKRKGKSSVITVPAINYTSAVKNATVVKIDCEGAEYQFDILSGKKLRAIILEFHPIVGEDWISNAKSIMAKFKKAGFKPLAIPEFKNGWDMHTTWIKS